MSYPTLRRIRIGLWLAGRGCLAAMTLALFLAFILVVKLLGGE